MCSSLNQSLQQFQVEFCNYLRQPAFEPIPSNLNQQRAKVYTKLLLNNINELLSNAFPVIHKTLASTAWQELIADFFAQHQSQTHLFHEIPKEFVKYLQYERQNNNDPAFLAELAHYEWVELALELSDAAVDWQHFDTNNNILTLELQWSPLAYFLAYQFPVHKIGANYQPEHPPAQLSYLLVYRNRNYQVEFRQLNSGTAYLSRLLYLKKLIKVQDIMNDMLTAFVEHDKKIVRQSVLNDLELYLREGILLAKKL